MQNITQVNCIASHARTRWLSFGVALCLILAAGRQASAVLIADDNFGASPQALAVDNSGVGWGSAWQVWFGAATVNNHQATVAGNTWAYRQLAAPVTLTAGDQAWFSFTAQETAPVTTFAGLSAFANWNESGFMGDPMFAPNTWGLQPSGLVNGSQLMNSTIPAHDSAVLVTRYAIDANGAGTMTLWVDPTSVAQLTGQAAVAQGTFSESALQFNTIRLASGDGAMSFGDIRLGSTAADVLPNVVAVPEPGSGFLFGLGLLGFGAARYRAHRRG